MKTSTRAWALTLAALALVAIVVITGLVLQQAWLVTHG